MRAATLRPIAAVLLTAAARVASAQATLDVTAMDFAFRAPATATAGVVTIRLQNTGAKLHHMQLFRLEEGKRLADLFPILYRNKGIAGAPSWAVPAGGPSAALPGRTIAVRQSLAPGRYAAICWIPAPDGALHFMKGMMAEIEVTGAALGAATGAAPGTATRPAAPEAGTRTEVRASLREYTVDLERPLTRETRTIRVENRGTQAHEFLLVRLAPGRTVDDVAHWSEKGQVGAAPVEEWMGVAGLAPGAVAWLDVRLRAGRYAIFCLSPDAKDGRPHLLHGFRTTFTVD